MLKIDLFFILFFTCIFSFYSHGQKLDKNTIQLISQIQKQIRKSKIPNRNMGLIVSDVLGKSRNPIFDLNSHRLFIPASLSKIVTASVVFHYFNPFDYFKTHFLTSAPIEDGVLEGPLYLKGGGDPSFVSETMWNLVNDLTRLGIKEVNGPLIVDSSLFEMKEQRGGWFLKEDRSFNAPIASLSFNWNSVNVYVQPGLNKLDPVKVHLDPQNSFLVLDNQATTQGSKNKLEVTRVKSKNYFKGDTIQVKGSIPLDTEERVIYKNISNPALWTGHQAVEFLKRRNIVVKGGVYTGVTPDSSRTLASVKGRSISRLVKDMMKYSSNFIADTLLFQISLKGNSSKGSWLDGLKKVRRYLEQIGIQKYNYVSPSGLSHRNKFKAADILKVLIRDIHSSYSYEKVASYPLGRGDGTLKRRFKNIEHPAMIRAKTGWLNKAVGLGGYTMNIQGNKRAFVFVYNGPAKHQWSAQKLFDDLAILLTRY